MVRKIRNIFIAILVIAVVIAGAYYGFLYYMGSKIFEEVARLEDQLAASGVDLNQIDKMISISPENTDNPSIQGTPDPAGGDADLHNDSAHTNAPIDKSQAGDTERPGSSGNSTPVKDNIDNKGNNEPKNNQTQDDITGSTPTPTSVPYESVLNKVSAGDRVKASTLLLKRLTNEDINELIKLFEGGVTSENMEKAKKIAYARFTESEITEIKEMYKKYIQ